jgi:hypothetical protein
MWLVAVVLLAFGMSRFLVIIARTVVGIAEAAG